MTISLSVPEQKVPLRVGSSSVQVSSRTRRLLYTSEDPSPPLPTMGLGISLRAAIFDGSVPVEHLGPNEPSTIFTSLPVDASADPKLVPRPSYYPSYAGLSPAQRWVYVSWLEDVTQPIDIGFVFIYYYGLERQLLIGDYAPAFDEILTLRAVHGSQASFDMYSRSGLLNAAVVHGDTERLRHLYAIAPPARFCDTDLMLAFRLGQDLGVEGLMRMVHAVPGVNKRYLKSDPDLFRTALSEVLTERYGVPLLPFASKYAISELPHAQQMLFANISFPDDVRNPQLPSFTSHRPLLDETQAVFLAAHERTKSLLALRRKLTKTKKLPRGTT